MFIDRSVITARASFTQLLKNNEALAVVPPLSFASFGSHIFLNSDVTAVIVLPNRVVASEEAGVGRLLTGTSG